MTRLDTTPVILPKSSPYLFIKATMCEDFILLNGFKPGHSLLDFKSYRFVVLKAKLIGGKNLNDMYPKVSLGSKN